MKTVLLSILLALVSVACGPDLYTAEVDDSVFTVETSEPQAYTPIPETEGLDFDPHFSWVCTNFRDSNWGDTYGYEQCLGLHDTPNSMCNKPREEWEYNPEYYDFYCGTTRDEVCLNTERLQRDNRVIREICEGADDFYHGFIRDCAEIVSQGAVDDDTCNPNVRQACEVCPRAEYLKYDTLQFANEEFYWGAVQGCLDTHIPECSHLI